MRINFDMDGTIANFYGVAGWLDYLKAEDTKPYEIAKPLVNFSTLARLLNKAQRNGHKIAIISWTSKSGSKEFNKAVAEVKKAWLVKHLPSVRWNEITIIPYGTPKTLYCYDAEDVLFDDEEPNRTDWEGVAYTEKNILNFLRSL